MYGVVLWSGQSGDRSLIWCEDHGNLAFCKSQYDAGSVLKSGDVVKFDMSESGEFRIASNVCLIAAEEYPALASALLGSSPVLRPVARPEESGVVPFRPWRVPGSDQAIRIKRRKRG